MIFGGEAFVDWIGEISLMKDLTKTMDITMQQMEEDEELSKETDAKLNVKDPAKSQSGEKPTTATPAATVADDEEAKKEGTAAGATSEAASGTSTPRRNWGQQAIMDKSEEEARMQAEGLSQEEKELRKKEKKKGLSKEQREQLAAFELERKKQREERVNTLARKLVDRLSVWTETDKGPDVTTAFQEKIRLEVENLKMESFGLEILHAIGSTYHSKGTSFLKSQKFLGISGFFSRLKDKGNLARETWTTISTALDAQMTMEEMAKLEEKGGEDWTDEKKAEYEKKVTGKILAAAWRGSKFEIQSVLREVCDQILNDKAIRLEKRVERAQALVVIGKYFQQAERDPNEEGEYMAFEELMADSMAKKDDKKKSAASATAAKQSTPNPSST
ncbi:DnaJ-like protein [Microsporum audouinii]